MPLAAGQAFFWALYGHKEPKPPKLLIITEALYRVLFQFPEGCLSSLILLLNSPASLFYGLLSSTVLWVSAITMVDCVFVSCSFILLAKITYCMSEEIKDVVFL